MVYAEVRRCAVASVLFLSLSAVPQSGEVGAQRATSEVAVRIRDTSGVAVPYAVLTTTAGARRVASDSGIVIVPLDRREDSLRVTVRRIGFVPFEGWMRVAEQGEAATISLIPIVQRLEAVDVSARRDTPLARNGFYNRMELARRGGFVAQFITPEELEQRNAIRVSQMVEAGTSVRVDRQGGIPILTSRRRDCAVTILLDGIPARGMVEEVHSLRGRQEIKREYGNDGPRELALWLRSRNNIDQLVGATNVAAIEVYASANSAPAEIQRAAGAEACAIVSIWTGGRQ